VSEEEEGALISTPRTNKTKQHPPLDNKNSIKFSNNNNFLLYRQAALLKN